MADDDEEYFFLGTPLREEEESRAGQRRKEVQDPAAEVTDEEGRRRFHGAFTGGYSAGYYNTVGSKEGWEPKAFKSSRDDRGAAKQQLAEDFMDEDERAEVARHSLQARGAYDTFGSAAAAREAASAAAAAAARPGAVPALVPAELIAPVADSVGVRLLQRMGWRQGKGIGAAAPAPDDAGGGAGRKRGRWGREAGLGADNTPIYALQAKTDTHGLGFDPFKGAEEFRAAKRGRDGGAVGAAAPELSTKRARGVAFGSGAADEDDAFGIAEDYAEGAAAPGAYTFELASDEEDDAPPAGRALGRS